MDLKVTVYKREDASKVKANVSVVVDDAIVIKDIRIVEGPKGLFVAMPSREKRVKNADASAKKEYIDIAHPISAEARETLINAIMEAYENAE